MIRQFNARYRVTVYSQTETTIVEYPITCKFTVTRGTFAQSNTATIQLYNLAPKTRNQIFQDAYTDGLNRGRWKYVELEAGWNGNISLIFKGRIMQAYSYKSGGQTDVITEIQAVALDIFDYPTSHTFAAGTTFKDALKTMASDMPNVLVANTGTLEGVFQTPTTFDGMAMEQINKLTGGHSFVDNGMLNTLMNNEVIDVPVPVISDNTVLLETPMRRDANIEVKTLFLPDLIAGQLVEIKSEVQTQFNGQFKLVGFAHDCLISPTQAGTRTTQLVLWIGELISNSNTAVTGETKTQEFTKVKGEKISPVSTGQPADVQSVYNYIQKNNGAIPNTKITKNISWKEMLGHDNTNAERKSEVTVAVLSNVYSTAQALQRFLNTYYPGRTATITSGWRSTANNTRCGGQPRSKHLSGLAVDFNVNGISTSNLIQNLSAAWNGYVQEYPGKYMCHAQLNSGKGRVNDV